MEISYCRTAYNKHGLEQEDLALIVGLAMPGRWKRFVGYSAAKVLSSPISSNYLHDPGRGPFCNRRTIADAEVVGDTCRR